MNDPSQQPGYLFAGVRLLGADYRLTSDSPPGVKGDLDVNYEDQVEVHGPEVRIRQTLKVRILDAADKSRTHLQLRVEVEGRFTSHPGANLTLDDFAQNHAPAILFPFTREWVARLTSAATPWPSVLIPPLNVLQLRRGQAKPTQ